MKQSLRIAVLALIIPFVCDTSSAQRKTAGATGSAQSHARARAVLEAGIAALGGLEAIRETQDVSVKVSGFSYARNQSVAVNPPYDKMTRDENLYIDLRNRRYIVETRDPLPGGFVFGGKQVINGNQAFFINPLDTNADASTPRCLSPPFLLIGFEPFLRLREHRGTDCRNRVLSPPGITCPTLPCS